MQEELTIIGEGFDAAPFDESAIEESTSVSETQTLRRSLRAIWNSWGWDTRNHIASFFFAVIIIGAIVGPLLAALAIWEHNGRTQAIYRARKMDGEIYTIKAVDYNFVGDTRLFLNDEGGHDAGWIMIHMNNPFTSEVNPIFLTFAGKGNEKLPLPMKVKVHLREEAWKDENVSSTRENFTGSFLEFERLDQKPPAFAK